MESSLLSGDLRQKSISHVIIDRIVRSIVSGELAPGTKLPPEDEFAARLGVGRSSVREAMKILEAFGVVEIRRADGVYISSAPKPQQVDPMVIGALASDTSVEHIVDLVIRMQSIVIPDLASPCVGEELEACSQLAEELFEEELSSAKVVERSFNLIGHIADLIGNPIIATLFRRSWQVGAVQLEQALDAVGKQASSFVRSFCVKLFSALRSSDTAEAARLLEIEREFLLSHPV